MYTQRLPKTWFDRGAIVLLAVSFWWWPEFVLLSTARDMLQSFAAAP